MARNRLAGSTSPYLLQHANNPVDWYPWGDEALKAAQEQDRPIFLSIGYAACHWCHVMAHESFEDPETAAFLNEHFVPIKVDREERPDLDALYMRAVQLSTGSGGWPLSVFLTPDCAPYLGGTYFPKGSRWGLPAFLAVLERALDIHRERRHQVQAESRALLDAVRRSFSGAAGGREPDSGISARAASRLTARLDERSGGFGTGPKFPQPALLRFLLDESLRSGEGQLAKKVFFALRRMEAGGVRDQVGGGFHRYSVDRDWVVPHFEKMLYDNAQLAALYFTAFDVSGDGELLKTAREICGDLLSSFAMPGGGLASSLDADSSGEEGSFYLWTPSQLRAALGEEDGLLMARLYGIGQGFELAERTLHRVFEWNVMAPMAGQDTPLFRKRIRKNLDRLKSVRSRRERPALDTKILTDWNALAALAFLAAFDSQKDPRDLDMATGLLDTLWGRAWAGRLLDHVLGQEEIRGLGFLRDYAYLGWACWEAFRTTGQVLWLDRMAQLVTSASERFRDAESGAFLDSRGGEGGLLLSVHEPEDGVLPSAQAVFARLLWHWERVVDSPEVAGWLDGLIRAESSFLEASPEALPLLAGLITDRVAPPVEVVVSAPSIHEARPLLEQARRAAPVGALVLPFAGGEPDLGALERFPLFSGKRNRGRPVAFVCIGGTCRETENADELVGWLRQCPASGWGGGPS